MCVTQCFTKLVPLFWKVDRRCQLTENTSHPKAHIERKRCPRSRFASILDCSLGLMWFFSLCRRQVIYFTFSQPAFFFLTHREKLEIIGFIFCLILHIVTPVEGRLNTSYKGCRINFWIWVTDSLVHAFISLLILHVLGSMLQTR